jgi:cell division protein FtsQ
MRFRSQPTDVRRRPPPSRRLRNAVQAALVVAAGGAAIFGPIWMWHAGVVADAADGLKAAAVAQSAELGLRIQNVFVTGRAGTEPAEILAALEGRRDGPILDFGPHGARGRVEALPWVARAAIDRRLPGDIWVAIEEHRPLAVWQNEGQIRMVAADGGIIDLAPPPQFADLPVVVGPDAPLHTLGLIRLLDVEPELARRVAAAIRVGGRRWNLEFDNGISVNLPEHDAVAAWRRLAVLTRDERLFDSGVTAVDLRFYPGKLVIRRAPGAPLVPRQEGKET